MSLHHPVLADRVHSQRDLQPDLYGAVDFDVVPYRFTTDPDVHSALPTWVAPREPLLVDERLVELLRTATMLGDVTGDPYAALAGTYGVGGLIAMVKQACRHGVASVPDAPPELAAFIESMEETPAWIDMALVDEGARWSRIPAAFLAPFLIRGAFLGTFINTYSALPMALTGALSGRRAAVRVNETSSFFAVTTLPGAMDRYGLGFEAAAMVRLMHSVVRCNALQRSEKWDLAVYGIPVPQVDQMPAGLINIYILSMGALRKGRTEFTPRERSIVEFARYRCFLLGLPEELLPTTPTGIVEVFHGRGALLRDDFDDEVCGGLVRSTMAAYLKQTDSWFDRVSDAVEMSWSTFFFTRAFCGGDRQRAARMGVRLRRRDVAVVTATAPFVLGRFAMVVRAARVPALQRVVDAWTIRTLERRLASYGTPEFTAKFAHQGQSNAQE